MGSFLSERACLEYGARHEKGERVEKLCVFVFFVFVFVFLFLYLYLYLENCGSSWTPLQNVSFACLSLIGCMSYLA